MADAALRSDAGWAMTTAERLVNELMLVSVLVAGEGDAALAAELEQAGASAAILAGTDTAAGFDLAILLSQPDAACTEATRATVTSLSGGSERLLFVPMPLGDAVGGGLPELPQWFELFAEFGYQPVIEFDAGFVSAGAFLVDRAAIAAESDLSAFADRLQLGPDTGSARASAPEATPAESGSMTDSELAATRRELAESRAELQASRAEADAVRARLASQEASGQIALQAIEARNTGWDGLRLWARAAAADPGRNTREALLRDLPRLNALRAPAPPFLLPPRRARWSRFWSPPDPTPILVDAALVRANHLFDAAWYIASNPDLAEGAALDPVFHYLLVGHRLGADPGPWFDTQVYLSAHPDLAGTDTAPLVHAIRSGEALGVRTTD